jgi:hypothetical protein
MLDISGRTSAEKDRARPSARRFCVLVTSSDRARDVFEIVFQNAESIWRDCDWPRFVGFTGKHSSLYGFQAVSAKGPSDWRQEVGDYLDALPELNAIADLMVRENLAYVRLVPVTRNFAGRIVEYFRRKLDKRPLRPISTAEPYYSSVELAIWKRSYLRSLLRRPGTIWEFEHTISDERHYAVWEPVIEQHQVVTRGKWNRSAPRLLARQGLSLANSKREFQSFGPWLRKMRESISFQLAGFLSFRLRRRLNRISRH